MNEPLGELRHDSNWVVTGFDNALAAMRRVDTFLDRQPTPALERLAVSLGQHGASTLVIFDSLIPWPASEHLADAADGDGACRHAAASSVTTALVAAFPGHDVYYTHDMVGFGIATGDLGLQTAIDAGEAVLVSSRPLRKRAQKDPCLGPGAGGSPGLPGSPLRR